MVAQGRINALSLLCIEDVIVESLQFDDFIDDYTPNRKQEDANPVV